MATLKMLVERHAISACSHSRDMDFFATVHIFFSDHSVGLRWFTACLVVVCVLQWVAERELSMLEAFHSSLSDVECIRVMLAMHVHAV